MSAPPTATPHQLLLAAQKGDHSLVVQLLDRGVPPNAVLEPHHITALHVAAENGSVEVVKVLLQRGAHPDARMSEGATPLYLAAFNGRMEVAAALLQHKACVQAHDSGDFTPLHAAAQEGHLSLIELLLDACSDMEAAAALGNTPLLSASGRGKHQAALLLLDRGAAVGAACNQGNTALHWACQKGHLEFVAVLLRAKASLAAVNNKGRTPLLLASSTGHEQVVRLLLSGGADPFTPDGAGSLPLHVACRGNHMQTAVHLLHGRRTQAHVNAPDAHHQTPLHLASGMGHAQMVSLLVEAGAYLEARDDTQSTPLHNAVSNGHSLVLEQLLAAGADPTALLHTGANALHVAAMLGHSGVLSVLLPAITAVAGQGVVDVEYQGSTPLHWAVENGNTSCVEALLAAGADPDKHFGVEAMSGNGSSLAGVLALQRAVGKQHTAIVPLLATPSNMRCMWQGRTPLHLALFLKEAGLEMAQALVAAGSPAWVPDDAGTTAMALASSSSIAGVQGLLPAMVRGECERYKRLQQQQDGLQQQQCQGRQQGPAAVLAAVVEGVAGLVSACVAAGVEWKPEPVAGCFQAVMEVLGPVLGGGLLQQVLDSVRGTPPAAVGSGLYMTGTLILYKVLHGAWLAELQPLLQHRAGVTLRFHRLVTQPPQLRQQVMSNACSAPPNTAELKEQASAAAAAGQWPLYVHLLEQLAGVHPLSADFVKNKVARALSAGLAPQPAGLCEALLGAWVAARQNLARRMQRELADAVVGAVRVWQQQQEQQAQQQPVPPPQQQQEVAVEGGRRKRQCTGRAMGR